MAKQNRDNWIGPKKISIHLFNTFGFFLYHIPQNELLNALDPKAVSPSGPQNSDLLISCQCVCSLKGSENQSLSPNLNHCLWWGPALEVTPSVNHLFGKQEKKKKPSTWIVFVNCCINHYFVEQFLYILTSPTVQFSDFLTWQTL